MKRAASPKLGAYAGSPPSGFAALALGRPELVASRRAVRAARGARALARARAELRVELVLGAERARGRRGRAEVEVESPRGPSTRAARCSREARRRPTGEPARDARGRASGGHWSSRCERALGRVPGRQSALRARDRARAFLVRGRVRLQQPLKVYPGGECAAHCSAHSRPRSSPATRSRARRATGSSSPTCAVRPGDRVRRVNWRASARRGVPWVNESPSGAQHGRRALPRHVRGGSARPARSLDASVRRGRGSPSHTCAQRTASASSPSEASSTG